MKYLRNVFPEEAESLLDYYLNGKYRQIRNYGNKTIIQNCPQIFSSNMWNVYVTKLNDEYRTYNLTENWNLHFSQLVE